MAAQNTAQAGSAREVFLVFLRLGLTSFGGPVAHLGYFREELVARRKWLDDAAYADLVALCQFMPGPASSQVGMGLGLLRAGGAGAAAAWIGFTLPSALVLILFAIGLEVFGGAAASGWLIGLKAAAAAVVAQAVWGMRASLAPDAPRATLAAAAAVGMLLAPAALSGLWPGGGAVIAAQLGVIGLGALIGLLFFRGLASAPSAEALALRAPVPRAIALLFLALFFLVLFGGPLLVASAETGAPAGAPPGPLAVADAYYRSGALVFGGGHVVLPLLEAETVGRGWIAREDFVAGYGAAQAVPGPLFTFAAFLGAGADVGPSGVLGGALALAAIFLPSVFLVVGLLPFWATLRNRPAIRAALIGVNAAVVGLLAAALYDPVWTSVAVGPGPVALVLLAGLALIVWRAPPWAVVAGAAAIGGALDAVAPSLLTGI